MHTNIQNLLDRLALQDDGVPIYVQIREQFLAAVRTGLLPAGSQLPTMRQVAVALRVDLNTVRHAYDELQRSGAVTLERGRGSFVAERAPAEPPADPAERLAESIISRIRKSGLDPVLVAQCIIRLTHGAKS
jgi:GntR family transcriptional regulator